MTRKWIFSIFVFGLLVMVGAQLMAQDDSVPPVVIGGYDLYAAENGGFRQLTNYPYNSELSMSPDGRFATYNSIPQVGIDAIERTGGFSGPMVTNIWMIDVVTGDARRIAGQPDPAYFWDDNQPDNVIARSRAAWSPNGTGVAWTDYYFADGHINLGIYDVTTDQYESLSINLPPQYGVPGPIPVTWLPSGVIAFPSYRYDTDSPNGEVLQIMVYSRTGSWLANYTPVEVVESSPRIAVYANYQGRDYYAQYDSANEQWVLMDVLRGSSFTTSGTPELVSMNNPDGSIALHIIGSRPTDQELAGQSNTYLVGEISDSAGNPIIADFPLGYVNWSDAPGFYLSPDGQAFIYRPYNQQTRVREDGFVVWRDGVETAYGMPVDGFHSLEIAWGGQMWRIRDDAHTVQISESPAFICTGALPPRLIVGQSAIVLPGSPNRVRDRASTSGNTVGQIPAGETFNVVSGPACGNGIVWWLVEYQGVSGWTAEGVDDYFVEPVN